MGGGYSAERYNTDRYADPYFAGKPKDAAKGKAVAITGATANGLGIWFAKHAAALGADPIILLNRASARATAAEAAVRAAAPAGVTVVTVDCDLTSFASVRAAIAPLRAACGGKLDVLMLNAGIMATPDEVTADGYNREVQVNVLSQMLLLKGAMPMLEAAAGDKGEARVCFHSSAARSMPGGPLHMEAFGKTTQGGLPHGLAGDNGNGMIGGGQAWKRYHQTKLANSVSWLMLHEKLQAKGSKVMSLCVTPGLAASDLQTKTNETGNMKAWETRLIFSLLGQSARDGSLPMTHACLMPGVQSGDFYEPGRMASLYGPPAPTATAGVFRKPWREKLTISTPEIKVAFWTAVEEAVGGPVV